MSMAMIERKPFLSDGLVCGDCPLLSSSEIEENFLEVAAALAFSEYVWAEDGTPPVLSWDSAFDEVVEERIQIADALAKKDVCLWPWRIMDVLPTERRVSEKLIWNQGMLPSCSMHGAVHAMEYTSLVEIALGAPLKYEALNPIYPFWSARCGNMSGGLTLSAAAREVNGEGMFSVSDVGDDNLHVDTAKLNRLRLNAKARQSAVIYLEKDFVDKIFRAARAGFYVVFGSGTVFTGAREDRYGVKCMSGRTHGGHAQCLGTWRKVKGKEYVWLQNSHGDIYGKSEEGEPASGAWVDKEKVGILAEDMACYGFPWIPLPEEPSRVKDEMMNKFSARFPSGLIV